MRIAGIVAEYNPYHNGHQLHARLTRERSGCDYVVAVMSGAFTQRGEPAFMDKWTRARMALLSGIDLVLELPALFAVRPAEQFALGGVSVLSALGLDVLSFGTETDDLSLLENMAELLETEPPVFRQLIRKHLDRGESHARARGAALAELTNLPPDQLDAPNTALALCYLRANLRVARPLSPLPIRRIGLYHDLTLSPIASASAVRRAIYEKGPDAARQSVPESSFDLIEKAAPDALSHPSALDALTLNRLRQMPPSAIALLPDVSEGLEMRIARIAREAASREELIERVKCKRYTRARLSRIMTYALLHLTRELSEGYLQGAPYARVLGFRQDARPLMRHVKENAAIPFVTDPVQLKGEPCFELERRATDLWGLTAEDNSLRRADRDLTGRVVIV